MKVLLCILIVCIASTSATFGDLFGNLLGGGGNSVQSVNQGPINKFSQPPPRPVQKHLVKIIHESSPHVHVVKLVQDDHYHNGGGHGNGHHDAVQIVKLVHAVPVEHYPVPVEHIHSSGWSYGGPAAYSPWD